MSSTTPSSSHPGSTSETRLDPRRAALCWRVLSSNNSVRMCMTEILHQLFGQNGIVVERGSQRMTPKPRFARYLQHHMRPFLIDAFSHVLVLGVVPVVFRRNALGERYPMVPRWGTYTITTYAIEGQQFFRFYWDTSTHASSMPGNFPTSYVYANDSTSRKIMMTNERNYGQSMSHTYGRFDPSVMVVHNFGYDPNLDGSLTSRLASILSHVLFRNELTDQAVTAERIAANPPMIYQFDPRLQIDAARRHTQGWFAGSAATGAGNTGPNESDERAAQTFQRDAEQLEAFRRHVAAHAAAHGLESAADAFGADVVIAMQNDGAADESSAPAAARNLQGHVMPWANQYFVGASRQLTNHQLPRPRGDYVQLTRQLDENICAALGVPRSIFIAETNVRSGVEAVNDTLNRTVKLWAQLLGELATLAYHQIFGDENLKVELEARIRNKTRRTKTERLIRLREMLTEDDLFEVERAVDIRLTFDLHPCSSPADLSFAYERRMIDWTTYVQRFLRCIGLREDDQLSDKDPLSNDDRKDLLFGAKRKDATAAAASQSTKTDGANKRRRPTTGDSFGKKQSSVSSQSKVKGSTN